jgi:hypothetical protein
MALSVRFRYLQEKMGIRVKRFSVLVDLLITKVWYVFSMKQDLLPIMSGFAS